MGEPRNSAGSGESKPPRDAALTWEVPPAAVDDEEAHTQAVTTTKAAFLDASAGHVDALVAQLLKAESVDNVKSWAPLVARLSREAAAILSPAALRQCGETDLSRHIKVKKVVVAAAQDLELPAAAEGSCSVDGVVCHKNVAHKRMRTSIQNPRILTLSGALEHDPAQDKLSSFNAAMEADRERLKTWVEDVTAVAPDVVLVEGGAARHAQELLLEAGMSLVTGVKPELLQRVARCVGSTVRPVGTALAQSCVGSCEAFEVMFPNGEGEEEAHPVMFFKGCRRGTGASMVLQGPSAEELVKLKRVAITAAYAALWNNLEAAFLAEQYLAAVPMVSAAARPGLLPSPLAVSLESVARAKGERGAFPITSASPHCTACSGGGLDGHGQAAVNFCDTQQLELALSCRNPVRGIRCEAPHLHSMPYYREGDLTLADFLLAAAPTDRKCPHPQCGEGATLHLRSFFHGDGLVTLSSVHLSPQKELPGARDRQVWLWMRPVGRDTLADGSAAQRIHLSADSAAVSFAHLLTLLLDARRLELSQLSLQHDFVRYLALGRTVICLHHSWIKPYRVTFPQPILRLAEEEPSLWLKDEVKTLTEEADEIFGLLEETIESITADGAECSPKFQVVRSTFMRMVHNIPTLSSSLPLSVEMVNKLRRHLVLIAQQEALLIRTKGSAADLQPSLARANSGASTIIQEQPLMNDIVSPAGRSVPQNYMAPKLVAADEKEPTTFRHLEAIPAGLVARYVAQFEQEPEVVQQEQAYEIPRGHSAQQQASTTIDLRGRGSIDLRRTLASDDEVGEDLESQLDGLMQELSLLASQVSATELEKSVKPSIPHTALQTVFNGRSMLLDGGDLQQAPVTVYDREPTSVVAYFLSTRQYQDFISESTITCLSSGNNEAAAELSSGPSADDAILLAPLQLDCQMIAEDAVVPDSRRARFQMTAYYAPHFAALRRLCIEGEEAAFVASIGRCIPWSAQGGKSNVFFAKTRDDRYIIKQLTRSEKQSFLGFAPDYFQHVQASLSTGGSSCLAKVLGIYQVQVEYLGGRSPPFGGKEGILDFMIMENLFHGCTVNAIYDLKGSERDRYATPPVGNSPAVLLDDNLRQLNNQSPTLVAPGAYYELQNNLCIDTSFLASLGVMDYSLLVGFNKTRQELVVGMVDYLRQYTWDKQVESWVKQSGLLGGAGKEPTIISPQQYARRFRAAMLSYFTVVPCLTKPLTTSDAHANISFI